MTGASASIAILLPPAALGPIPHLATRMLAIILAVRAIGDFRCVGFFKSL